MRSLVLLLGLAALANAQTDGVGVLIMGYGGGVSMEVVTADKTCQGSLSVPALPLAPSGANEGPVAQYVDGKYYVCGGSDFNFADKCYSLTIGGGSWVDSGILSSGREKATSLIFNGEMMVMGGYNRNAGWLTSVEKKTAMSELWTEMEEWEMPVGLFDLCAEQSGPNEIIVVGGNEYGAEFRNQVMLLDTTTGTWSDGAVLTGGGRSAHGCMNYNFNGEDGLMVTGGCTDRCIDHYNDVWFFGYTTRAWTQMPSMVEKRMGHQMAWIDGMPAVVGGYESSLKPEIEVFDGTKWILRDDKLSEGRWAYGMPRYVPKSEVTCA